MKRLLLPAFVLFAVLLSARPVFAQDVVPDKRAQGLLALMAASYSEAQSYSDTSTAIYRNPDGSERLRVEFKTWFARPNEFRIDASSRTPKSKAPRREVMWTNGAAARAWASDKPVSSKPQVKIIGSGMFGTYAYHIPTLLEESYGGARRLHELESPVFVGAELVEDVHCYRIRGGWLGDEYEVWIGTADNLVRKITAKYADHLLEEIHREVAVNTEISKEVFRFAPEEEKLPATPRTAKSTSPSPSPAPSASPRR